MKRITAFLNTRALLAGLLAFVGLASIVAIAYAAPTIPADATPPAGHSGGACSGCHTVTPVTPPVTPPPVTPPGDTPVVNPPTRLGVPDVDHDSDDASETVDADESDDVNDIDEADDDAAEVEEADKPDGIEADDNAHDADDEASPAPAPQTKSRETVRAHVSEHDEASQPQGGMNSSKVHPRGDADTGSGSHD